MTRGFARAVLSVRQIMLPATIIATVIGGVEAQLCGVPAVQLLSAHIKNHVHEDAARVVCPRMICESVFSIRSRVRMAVTSGG